MIELEELAGLVRRELRGKASGDIVLDENTELANLGLSSLQIAEIVFKLEDEHEVEFDPARAAEAKTLGDVLALGNEAILASAEHQ
jgi:acyl carrier protein